jgi:hypothetical protein
MISFLIAVLVALSEAGQRDSCATAVCDSGTECNPLSGVCDPVSCDAPNACQYGETCVPRETRCVTTPCPQFECVANPCSLSSCPKGSECDTMTGECLAVSCAHAHCPEGTTCRATSSQRCRGRYCRQFECVCPNEEQTFKECGSTCPSSCDSLDHPPEMCTQTCVRGCFCPRGTVSSGDHCVSPLDCPCAEGACGAPLGIMTTRCSDGSTGGPTGRCIRDPATLRCHWEVRACPDSCTGNKEYKTCGPACQPTCAQPNPNEDGNCSSAPCVAGCFCESGKILDASSGQCVAQSQCPDGSGSDEGDGN